MQISRHPRPPPRRAEWLPLSTLIRDSTIRHSPSLLPRPQQRPSGERPRGIANSASGLGYSKLPPHPWPAGPFSRDSDWGVHSIIPGHYAPVSFILRRSQACFRNPLGVLHIAASAHTQLMHLTRRKVIKTSAIHDRGLRGSAVLVKGGKRKWELNQKGS